jgi:Xaa-Pro dipeptidase
MRRGCITITAAPDCSGLRGAVGGDITLFRDAAPRSGRCSTPRRRRHAARLDVVEPPMLFELQKLGIEVVDGQQVMLQAREVKNIDELTLLNMAAAMVDGVYQDIAEALKPGVRESEIVALATRGCTEWDPIASRRSMRSRASAARRIRTTSPTG